MKTEKRSRKNKSLGDRLIAGLKEAVDFANGKDVPRIRVHTPEAYDVRKIRGRLKLSQAEFAARYGFALAALQNWEQGRRIPDKAARTLLAVIAYDHKAVERALLAAAG